MVLYCDCVKQYGTQYRHTYTRSPCKVVFFAKKSPLGWQKVLTDNPHQKLYISFKIQRACDSSFSNEISKPFTSPFNKKAVVNSFPKVPASRCGLSFVLRTSHHLRMAFLFCQEIFQKQNILICFLFIIGETLAIKVY